MTKRSRPEHGLSDDISPPPSRRRQAHPFSTAPQVCSPSPDQPYTPSKSTDTHLSIYSWNINGLKPLLTPTILSPTPPLLTFLGRHSYPPIILLQELKISPTDRRTPHSLHALLSGTADAACPAYDVHISLPRDQYNARGFGRCLYGVATLTRRSLIAEYPCTTSAPAWDLEGRVLVTVFTTLRLAVVNVYAVNGTENPHRDPVTGAVKGTRHHFKRSFHGRLVEECKRLEDAGLRVVVGGDVNIAREAIDGFPGIRLGEEHVNNRSDFNEKFFDGEDGLRAVDAWREMRGGEMKYTYYPPRRAWGSSCDRVDMFILSRALVGAGNGQGGTLRGVKIWDNVLERGSSDHVPLSVVLNLEMLASRGTVSEGVENETQSGKIGQS